MILDYLAWLAVNPVWAFLLLLIQFIIFMKLYHRYEQKKSLKILFGLIFQPQNFVVNATGISLIGWELPKWGEKEFVTTQRMHRWKQLEPDTQLNAWRLKFSTKLCEILNKYDQGHC